MTQVCMASQMHRVKYGTSLHGQSLESCKVWYRSAWPVTRMVNTKAQVCMTIKRIVRSMAQVCMASHMNRVNYGTGLYGHHMNFVKYGTGLHGQSNASYKEWRKSAWPVT